MVSVYLCGGITDYILYIVRRFLYTTGMIFPLKELIEYDQNMYEITAAASRRSYQLSVLLDKESKEDYDGKMVALAASQLFTDEVQFRLEA